MPAEPGDPGSPGELLLELRLPPDPRSVGRARAHLDQLSPALPGADLDDLQLLVSELVTNSLRHAGLGPEEMIDLRVQRLDAVLRVEVTDPGRRFRVAPSERPSAHGGWGLHIVEHLAARWGVDAAHNRVWFELPWTA